MPASLTFSAPTLVAQLTNAGVPDNTHGAAPFQYPIQTATWAATSGGRATFTVDADIDTANGSTFTVIISGMTPSGYNGTYTATVNNAARTQFYVPLVTNPGTATVMGIAEKNTAGLFVRPSAPTTDTRKWDVFGADLAFPYDGKDGYVYTFLGDTFGSDWNGPGTTHSGSGSSTIAAASNGVAINTFTGTQTMNIAGSGSFQGAGGYVVVQLSSASNALAYFRYGGKGTGTLTNVRFIACTAAGSSTLTTGDTAKGDDTWTGGGWRSNTLFRHSDTNLSDGITIDTFKNLNSQNIAKTAIPTNHDGEVSTFVFPASKTMSLGSTSLSRTSNIVTVTVTAAHRFAVGNVITISGVTDTSFNGTFTVASVTGNTTFTYAQTGPNATSSGGTAAQTAPISSISCTDTFTVNITTSVAHGLSVGQGVLIAGTGVRDGEDIVRSVGSSTTFTIWSWGSNGSASTGTMAPASFRYADPVDPASGASDGSAIPSGAIAIPGQSAAATITAASWASGVATITSANHKAYVGETVTITGVTPSGYNGTVIVTAVTANTLSYALASNPGAYTSGGSLFWARHYAYYLSIAYFSTLPGQWYSNYMGIAYSDDKGDTWTRYGVSGASFNSADITKVWSNNSTYTDNFQQAWPIDGQDGYVYCLCARAGRFGDAYLMRVAYANILSKSSYTYWTGSTWSSSISSAQPVYTGNQSEPTVFFHSGTSQWISVYLYSDLVFGNYIAVRNADSLTGPWTSPQVLMLTSKFGTNDIYGGWIHPWSNKSPQSGTDFYFHISSFAPYSTYLLKTTITSAASSTSNFFGML